VKLLSVNIVMKLVIVSAFKSVSGVTVDFNITISLKSVGNFATNTSIAVVYSLSDTLLKSVIDKESITESLNNPSVFNKVFSEIILFSVLNVTSSKVYLLLELSISIFFNKVIFNDLDHNRIHSHNYCESFLIRSILITIY
jgi:hypothetical protein